jgi:D-3-phosphoglycerate dehydrogenase
MNITGQYLSTDDKVGYVISDLDKEYNQEVLNELRAVEGTIKFRVLY